MITTIIFDWHGVLDKTKFFAFVEALAGVLGRSVEKVYPEIEAQGKIYTEGGNPEEFWEYVRKKFRLNPEQLSVVKGALLKVVKNEELWILLPTLKESYKLAILSDCSTDKLKVIRDSADLTMFKPVMFSAETGVSKSSDEFFVSMLNKLGETAPNCLYVDDNDKPIEMAKDLGFQVCKFGHINDLIRCLR